MQTTTAIGKMKNPAQLHPTVRAAGVACRIFFYFIFFNRQKRARACRSQSVALLVVQITLGRFHPDVVRSANQRPQNDSVLDSRAVSVFGSGASTSWFPAYFQGPTAPLPAHWGLTAHRVVSCSALAVSVGVYVLKAVS